MGSFRSPCVFGRDKKLIGGAGLVFAMPVVAGMARMLVVDGRLTISEDSGEEDTKGAEIEEDESECDGCERLEGDVTKSRILSE